MLTALGGLLMLAAGGRLLRPWTAAFFWGALTVGMIFFTGVALINGWVMHAITARGAPESDPLLYYAFNRLLIGYGWLGNPLFLLGLTGLAWLEVRGPAPLLSRPVAWFGLSSVFSPGAAASARPPAGTFSSR